MVSLLVEPRDEISRRAAYPSTQHQQEGKKRMDGNLNPRGQPAGKVGVQARVGPLHLVRQVDGLLDWHILSCPSSIIHRAEREARTLCAPGCVETH